MLELVLTKPELQLTALPASIIALVLLALVCIEIQKLIQEKNV